MRLLGVDGNYLNAQGIDYHALISFCAIWGMGGAFISLLMSRFMAKMLMGVKVIDPNKAGQYQDLYNLVESLARRASLPTPEVGVYESKDPNAFATGPTKSSSLVAVSTGLLNRMNRDELEGVLAHEVAHIANGDMVTMTLLQGVINAFVMVLSRIIAFAMSRGGNNESRGGNPFLIIILQIVLSLLGSIIVCWFSRKREFSADAGSASLAGKQKMIMALRALQKTVDLTAEEKHESFASLQISSRSAFISLFSTHPALEDRIQALENNTIN